MDSKKRRSTLRKSVSNDVDNIKTQLRRRISFSGKNSVRVFHGEEEPKTWNNSYEISDHLNGNETASNLGAAPLANKTPRSALKNKHNNKENVGQCNTTQQELQMENNSQQKNISISNNQSVLSTTKDLINISYQNQNSKMYHIENSVDITLYEREIHFQQSGQNKTCEQTTNNLCSFSLDDNEKEDRSIIFGERTVDFMRELRGDLSNIRGDDTKTIDIKDDKCATVFSEYMDEGHYLDYTCTKVKSSKEPITIYMNDSLSISGNEEITKNNRRTIQLATAMNISPNMAKQYDKENINPTSLPNVNETQIETCEMEINDEISLPSQTHDVNVQKETLEFQEKLNRLSFLQESDDNIDNSLDARLAMPNTKASSTINYNEVMEISPKEAVVKNKINSRSTINCNQFIEISPKDNKESSQIKMPIKKANIRKSINFNKTIEFSPKNVDAKSGHLLFPKDKSQQTLNFNQSMEIDSKNVLVGECSNQHGTIPKIKPRPTINFHQPIETSPPNLKINLQRQTINLNEDISESPVKTSQEPLSTNNNLNVPGSIRKHGQLPKLVVRKICTPLVNKNKNPIDLEQQRMLRYKKKQEQNEASGNVKKVAAVGMDTVNPSNADKSLNFSLSSVKNMSLSPESSSPLVPSEFKALNFKQLNDELERGKINVFANAPKTPSTDRKYRNTASNFSSKAFQSSSQPLTKQRRTLVFDDVDIPLSSGDTLNKDPKTPKSNNYFDFNCTTDAIEQKKKNNAKCRYSQADDIMLDNTSFLTRAKLSDETVCRSTSKREITQLNDIMDLFDESLRDAASKLDRGLSGSCVNAKKSCNKNETLSSMFQNAKPIFTQAIANIKDCNNYLDAYDVMDISIEVNSSKFKKHGNNCESNFPYSRQTTHLIQNIEPCDVYTSNNTNNKDSNRNKPASICANAEMEIDDPFGHHPEQKLDEKITSKSISHNNHIEKKEHTNKEIENQFEKETLHMVEDIEVNNADTVTYNSKPTRKTLHFNNELCELDESVAQQQFDRRSANIVETVSNNTNDAQIETSDKDDAYLNTRQVHNLVEKCPRQTIYLNNSIEESFKKIHEEKSIKSTKVYDGFYDNYINLDCNPTNSKGENINMNCTDIISSDVYTSNNTNNKDSNRNKPASICANAEMEIDDPFGHHPEQKLDEKITSKSISHNNDIEKKEHTNKEIENQFEKETLHMVEDIEVNNADTVTYNSKPTRKTLHFNNELCELDESVAQQQFDRRSANIVETVSNNTNNAQIETSDKDDAYLNTRQVHNLVEKCPRQTIYLNNSIEESFKKIHEEKSIKSTKVYDGCYDNYINLDCNPTNSKGENINMNCTDIISSKRQTLYPNDDIGEEILNHAEEETVIPPNNQNLCEESKKPRRNTIYFDNDNIIDYDQVIDKDREQFDIDKTGLTLICNQEINFDETFEKSEQSLAPIQMEKNIETENKKSMRKTVYFHNEIPLEIDTIRTKNNTEAEDDFSSNPLRKTLYFNNEIQSENPIQSTEAENVNKGNFNSKPLRKTPYFNKDTLYFDDNNEISIDQSFTPAENYEFPELGEPLNVAKMRLARHTKTNSTTSKSKLTNTQENVPMTPENCAGSNSNHRLFYMTPRLSLLEFTAAEKKAREEERLQNMKFVSPLRTEASNKRLPVNLTPVLSIPKKRQTLVFDDCLIDESSASLQDEKCIEKPESPKEHDYNMEVTKEQEPFCQSKRGTYDQAMEISGIVANESLLHTPPPKQRKSCIPIPTNSAKKSNKSLVETSSDNHREADAQFDIEGDNLVEESIQFMRRATTFTQRRDTTLGPIDLNIENDPARKPSIFEGNPITISDVSVFFEAQRKSNSLVPEIEKNLAVEQIDVSGLKAIERAKKSLENHHLNLTLEDIEKTRLSLVRISYEEQEDHFTEDASPPSDDVVNEDVENNLDSKNKRQSMNYLRNVSAVCRKCKRCQETVLNETTSSTYDSFVLPPLPPLPDLGLDRLRRLRKRPIISDVNIMWQRVSLDRTIINPFNISDDESQIISDLDEEAEDESSTVTKCIRNYKNDMLSLEHDLLGKQQNKPFTEERSFVLRLDTLLSANSTNWIFDFQMQSRGILLFTHKQLFTFAVSLKFDEIDSFGKDISVKSVKLEKGHLLEKNWKAIDFVLDFQLKLNLPFDLQSLCEGNNEADVFKMLQAIDRVCLDTIKMGNHLQRITFTNQASIIRDELRTYVRKIIRKIVKRTDSDFRYVEKTEIKIELLNLKKLSFKNIFSPSLYNFREEIHLLPTGLQFLEDFLPNPLKFMNEH